MSENRRDYEAENMSDLVRLINSKNNAGRIKKILTEHKQKKEASKKRG
ncbi:hypothetical protein [Bacillus sp. MUM 13]|nr:hypothetical protein [Bacillus sp. MUM 13]